MVIQAQMIWFVFFLLVKLRQSKIKNFNDKKIRDFEEALRKVLLNLAKRVVSDGEGSFKIYNYKC